MNIFYLDSDPVVCARYHNDKHVVKMIVESCQLLSTAHHVLDDSIPTYHEKKEIIYKATHKNHPSGIWTRESAKNYKWLWQLTKALCAEYTHRYGKIHKCESSGLLDFLQTPPVNINKAGEFTTPPLAMPDDCKISEDAIASYKQYYMKHKHHIANWKNREIPDWFRTEPVSL